MNELPDHLPITYRMQNTIDGKSYEISGTGHWSGNGTTEVTVTLPNMPPHWNGVLLPCICSGPGPGPSNGRSGRYGGLLAYASNGYRTAPGTFRKAILFDESGKKAATVRATGVYARTATGLDFNIEVETWIRDGSELAALNKIDHYGFTIHPLDDNHVLVYSQYGLSGNGRKVFGCTQIHYEFIGTEGVKAVTQDIFGINTIAVVFNGSQMSYESRQVIRPTSDFGQPA